MSMTEDQHKAPERVNPRRLLGVPLQRLSFSPCACSFLRAHSVGFRAGSSSL